MQDARRHARGEPGAAALDAMLKRLDEREIGAPWSESKTEGDGLRARFNRKRLHPEQGSYQLRSQRAAAVQAAAARARRQLT